MAYPDPTNLTSAPLLVEHLKNLTSGMFFDGLLYMIWLIILISFAYIYPKEESFALSSFIFMILAIMGKALNAVSDVTMAISIIVAIAGAGWMWIRPSR